MAEDDGTRSSLPVDDQDEEARVTAARRRLLDRLSRQDVVNAGRWTRDELYERGERPSLT
jgi:hypothetical protein